MFLSKYHEIFHSPSLNFEHHINITIRKSLNILAFIKRMSRMHSSPSCLCSIYSDFVHLTQKYGVVEIGILIWQCTSWELNGLRTSLRSYAPYFLKIEHPRHGYCSVSRSLNISILSVCHFTSDTIFISSLHNCIMDIPVFLSSIQFQF